jgi:hypothetical protein
MRYARFAGLAAALFACAGCDLGRTRPAHGDVTTVIAVAMDSVWAATGEQIETTLEPRTFTVRDEKMFELTWVSPASEDWLDLRRFRQVLAIGVPGDGWIAPVLEQYEGTVEPPAVIEQQDVWARNQLVTAIVLPQGSGPDAALSQIPAVSELLDRRFRVYARQRMFLSGADSALGDTLQMERGYRLLVPAIYRRTRLENADVFRNHSEMRGILLRGLYVAWREGVVAEPSPELALAWRDSASASAYDPQQLVQRDRIESRPVTVNGANGIEVQGVWTSQEPSWPAAGPFIDRILVCPAQNRTYYLDAWLYAPGKRKYEYMIQLETILDSFRCNGGAAAAAAR